MCSLAYKIVYAQWKCIHSLHLLLTLDINNGNLLFPMGRAKQKEHRDILKCLA